jgi:hypothetical protein
MQCSAASCHFVISVKDQVLDPYKTTGRIMVSYILIFKV